MGESSSQPSVPATVKFSINGKTLVIHERRNAKSVLRTLPDPVVTHRDKEAVCSRNRLSHSDARLSSLLEIESDFSITNVFLEISFA